MRQDPSERGGLQLDNAFWRFSLAVYAQTGVAEECLALQEAIGADVNLLLFCAWLGSQGRVLSGTELEAARGGVDPWHDAIVLPLRKVRQQVKAMSAGRLETFRTTVKAVELESEQIEQAMLFAFAQRLDLGDAGGRDAVVENVKKYIALLSQVAAPHAAPRLVDAACRSPG